MTKIDFLTIVYKDYCTKHNLPFVSADEQELNESDKKHIDWRGNIIEMWNYAEDN